MRTSNGRTFAEIWICCPLSNLSATGAWSPSAETSSVCQVKKGALCRFRLFPEGQRLILQFLFRGDGFGYEIGPNHRDSVRALANTELSVAGRKALLAASAADARSSNLLFA